MKDVNQPKKTKTKHNHWSCTAGWPRATSALYCQHVFINTSFVWQFAKCFYPRFAVEFDSSHWIENHWLLLMLLHVYKPCTHCPFHSIRTTPATADTISVLCLSSLNNKGHCSHHLLYNPAISEGFLDLIVMQTKLLLLLWLLLYVQ